MTSFNKFLKVVKSFRKGKIPKRVFQKCLKGVENVLAGVKKYSKCSLKASQKGCETVTNRALKVLDGFEVSNVEELLKRTIMGIKAVSKRDQKEFQRV